MIKDIFKFTKGCHEERVSICSLDFQTVKATGLSPSLDQRQNVGKGRVIQQQAFSHELGRSLLGGKTGERIKFSEESLHPKAFEILSS